MLWLNLGVEPWFNGKITSGAANSSHNLTSSKEISGISGEGSGWLLEKVKTVVLIFGFCMGLNMKILIMKFLKAQMLTPRCGCSLPGITMPGNIAGGRPNGSLDRRGEIKLCLFAETGHAASPRCW